MQWKEIIGQNFTPEQFLEYVRGLVWDDWAPEFITLHHTAVPSLAQRSQGLTHQHILNLEKYYRDQMGWSAGPHLFVDDHQIWVFTPLTTPGVHAKSFNRYSIGVEMLGDYDREDFNSGRGLVVQQNAVAAIAMLSEVLDVDPDSMMCHRDEPNTSKTCPGNNVDKADFIRAVKDCLAGESLTARIDQPEREEETFPEPKTNAVLDPREYGRAQERLPIFKAAADTYKWPPEVEQVMQAYLGPNWMVWILAGIDSRESRFGLLLDANGLGDGGHGHGEMQIDNRSHAVFCASGRWHDLSASLEYVHHNVIIPGFNYLGDRFELFNENYSALFRGAIAAYNCGPGNVRKALKAGQDVDARTTGRDYSIDVFNRARQLRAELETFAPQPTPQSVPETVQEAEPRPPEQPLPATQTTGFWTAIIRILKGVWR